MERIAMLVVFTEGTTLDDANEIYQKMVWDSDASGTESVAPREFDDSQGKPVFYIP